jgi:ABC-2 type transport system permease protein
MTGFGAFLGKELHEIVRTWRIWVIPGLVVFFAVTSPFVALLTPALVASIAADQPGVVIQLPDPTALDAFGQFVKNLSQLVELAVVIAGAGVVSGERASGTAVLTLTKPLSRGAFVLAKIASQTTLVVGATIVGTLLTVGVTGLLFDDPPVGALVRAVGLWLGFALLLVVVMTFFSVALRSRGGAAGAGLGFLFVTLLVGSWPPAAETTFAGLHGATGQMLTGRAAAIGWPLATAAVAALAFGAAAVGLFRRQEL